MSEDIQWMSYDLMRHFCVNVTPNRWRTLHGYNVAMNNRTGFNGDTPFADYVNREDLDASLPRYDKMQRTFEGSFITGHLDGNLIWCEPGIDGINAVGFTYLPGTPEAADVLAEIIDKRWYSIAVCTGNPPFHFRANWGGWIVYPFIFDRPISFESRFFQRWERDYLPAPLEVYG
jgi:hypothetical protein